ncbi:hypothetical protein PROAA_670001 [Candidatus Propionivibrio aalborgensis]|uniref:Uncharacterized protein n=1 Tax=Candidatus Propionivibrio aalborgensis TaxID=1860101 RepID=A0A1A8Y0V7_9RHOO|nr:hypothetical protein [Candidatus Propionivibrio aalborgensis]MBK7326916.1 hypothetical protein [Propionivibrio sp.]MBK9026700.1 hypothetical protein [Propionivibrio sp.]MBP6421478.1 hypothetical protein [Propionivibrio sp.]SBT10774.1 hypothetical protein PROAA_660008 [Candidatus Propionivibrio aalborgensis]SBT10775.1 hypothetical protein PROAA_670001 [Candidatus Propionivibrio aalborgensis]
MQITIESPGGPRQGVVPSDGIVDEATLIKALILTLAVEGNKGVDYVTLEVDLSDAEPERLVEVAKALGNKGH